MREGERERGRERERGGEREGEREKERERGGEREKERERRQWWERHSVEARISWLDNRQLVKVVVADVMLPQVIDDCENQRCIKTYVA